MRNVPKITAADYDDLLASVEAGTTQRELARRYGCAPSLIARHLARAKQSRARAEPVDECDSRVAPVPHAGSIRAILEARIRDPETSARDLASLANVLARLDEEEQVEQVKVVTVDATGKVIESALSWAPPGVTLAAPNPERLIEEGISAEDVGLIIQFPLPPHLRASPDSP
jgi:transposase-like protein